MLLYASRYNDVEAIINISGRFNLERGMEGRLGKDFQNRIDRNGFIDVKSRRGRWLLIFYLLCQRLCIFISVCLDIIVSNIVGRFEYRVTKESLMDRLTTDTRAACLAISQSCR